MKRTALLRRAPLARSWKRRGASRSAYATRARDFAYLLGVKQLPCAARGLGGCAGPIEADHAGRRGLSHKAADDTAIPLCTTHHRARTDFAPPFRSWDQARMRAWLEAAIENTRQLMAQRSAA